MKKDNIIEQIDEKEQLKIRKSVLNNIASLKKMSQEKQDETCGICFEELKSLGKEKIAGKIVFFNRPMDPTQISTGSAYGGAVNQRGRGATEAAKYGAIGVVVRSVTLAHDEFAHTGAMYYNDSFPKIPACAISSNHADALSRSIKQNNQTKYSNKIIKQNIQTKYSNKSIK